jgi:hypothetical protein
MWPDAHRLPEKEPFAGRSVPRRNVARGGRRVGAHELRQLVEFRRRQARKASIPRAGTPLDRLAGLLETVRPQPPRIRQVRPAFGTACIAAVADGTLQVIEGADILRRNVEREECARREGGESHGPV